MARLYRRPMEAVESVLPLPDVPPLAWTVAGVVLSTLAFAPFAEGTSRALLVVAVLTADWLDGATARRYGPRRRGQLMDVTADRISEALIFASDATPLGQGMLLLAAANTALVIAGRARGHHWALPLRFAYLAALLIRAS